MATHSTWQEFGIPSYSRLTENRSFDVVIVGGGITGLTSAYLLKLAGKTVCVLERDRLADVDTGHTTAHLTYVTDLRLNQLVSRFGREGARLAWTGGAAAINTIESIADGESIDCELRRVPGFLHAALQGKRDESDGLEQDFELARELGFHATYLESVPLIDKPGIRFANQAKFHPRKYCAGLAQAIDGDGSAIFEHAEVSEASGNGPQVVKVGGLEVRCEHLIIATHVPLMGKTSIVPATIFQSKLAPYSSYVIEAEIPRGRVAEACYWDTSDPYHYLRVDAGAGTAAGDRVIFGGEDHKTGQDDAPADRFEELEAAAKKLVPRIDVTHRWSGQVIETNDGLPFIGEMGERQFAATGFAGNGMTFGTLGGMMAADAVSGRDNPWASLFDTARTKVRGGLWDYLKENKDYPYYLIRDRFAGAEARSLRDIPRGTGRITDVNGTRAAVFRADDGSITALSPVCTHMGCHVQWNDAERTWDCPCHGSRFMPRGEVLSGPAESPLEEIAVPEHQSR